MKNILLSGILCLVICPGTAFSQEYSYTNYNIANGLAGSSLYCITQDKDGFIWVGTEAGVSRFDGAHFRNFTTKDGLPDLEVLQIFGDSKGRVWIAPFRKAVCFYYQGKIHNAENDSILSHIHLDHNAEGFAEDAKGNILIEERTSLQIVKPDGSIVRFDSLGGERINECVASSVSPSGNFFALIGGWIMEFSPAGLLGKDPVNLPVDYRNRNFVAMNSALVTWLGSTSTYFIQSLSNGKLSSQNFDPERNGHISFSVVGDSLVYWNGSSGSAEHNFYTGQTRLYLPGFRVSKVFRDNFGNLWLTSIGKGLFRLNSNDTRLVRLAGANGQPANVLGLARLGDQLWVGDDHERIFRLSVPDMTAKGGQLFFHYASNRILYLGLTDRDKLVAGTDDGLFEGTREPRFLRRLSTGVKSAVRVDEHTLLVGFSWGAATVDLPTFRITDTLWHERSTVVFYTKDTVYVGTLNGLYRSVKGQPPVFLGEQTPFLRRRISSIAQSADGTLWISSYDAGIIGFRDGRQTISITSRSGLTSDFCRTLLVHGNALWAGTDKGLNRISLDKRDYTVTRYTSRDGLASDVINAICADSAVVYVGTPEGLNYFDEHKMTSESHCLLYLLSVMNDDRDRIADTSHLVINYSARHLRFEFAAIDYKSAGDITYRYRMSGLDDKWIETKQNELEYPDMPPGNYTFQLQAIDRFGVLSRMLTVPLEVTAPLWKRPWFIVAAWLASLGLLWTLVSLRLRRLRRRQQEKEQLVHEMNQLKNTALKSQMNPHFIFNCLNSIQHSIFAGDTDAANSYISGLARLIRMTLNDSSRAFVSVGDEVDYLGLYLQLEKMRFREKIGYEITVDPAVDRTIVLIPPMLIQPYVENALHHGLRPKTEGVGRVSIRIERKDDRLLVLVEDNGVGRAPAEYAITTDEHLSKGMSLTEGRLEILSRLYERPFGINVLDLKDENGRPAGTRIVIDLPLFLESSLYT
jgi:ligand-binding sensor domain-containing protein